MLCTLTYVSPAIREEQLKSRINDLQSQMLELSRTISPSSKAHQDHSTLKTRTSIADRLISSVLNFTGCLPRVAWPFLFATLTYLAEGRTNFFWVTTLVCMITSGIIYWKTSYNCTTHHPDRLITRVLNFTGCLSWVAWPFLFPTFTYLAEGRTNFFWATTVVCTIVSAIICWKTLSREICVIMCKIFKCFRERVSEIANVRLMSPSSWCTNRVTAQLAAALSSATATAMLLVHHLDGKLGDCPCYWMALLPLASGILISRIVFGKYFDGSSALPIVVNEKTFKKSKGMASRRNVLDIGSSPLLRKSSNSLQAGLETPGIELSNSYVFRFPFETLNCFRR